MSDLVQDDRRNSASSGGDQADARPHAGRTRVARTMMMIAAAAATLYVTAGLGLYAFQRKLVFVQDQTRHPPAVIDLPEVAVHRLTTADKVEIDAWLLRSGADRLTIYFHGNGGALSWRGESIRQLTGFGGSVLAVEYRGYGGSDGKPSEAGLARDADAAYDFAVRLGYRPDQIVLYGESLGAAVAVELGSRRPVAALVLDAPFSSLADVAAARFPFFPVRLFLSDPFPSDQRIAGITAPVLIMHGEDDRVVPIRFGRQLAASGGANVTFRAVPSADHIVLSDDDARQFAINWLGKAIAGRVAVEPR